MEETTPQAPLRSLQRKACETCGQPAIARGLCPKHYDQRKRAGTLPPSSRGAAGPLMRVKGSVPRRHVAKLKRMADQLGVRMTDMLRIVVAFYLERSEQEPEQKV